MTEILNNHWLFAGPYRYLESERINKLPNYAAKLSSSTNFTFMESYIFWGEHKDKAVTTRYFEMLTNMASHIQSTYD